MAKQPSAARLDDVQARVGRFLKPLGFRKRGRTFSRAGDAGLAQLVNLQAGQFPVGGWREVPPIRLNLYGKFTVNLGVFVPEIYAATLRREPPARVQEYDCALRARLGELEAPAVDRWWDLTDEAEATATDVVRLLDRVGLPFLERFASRDAIRRDWVDFAEAHSLAPAARIHAAIVAAHQGERDAAISLLCEQQRMATVNPRHAEYVSELAERLGVGPLPTGGGLTMH